MLLSCACIFFLPLSILVITISLNFRGTFSACWYVSKIFSSHLSSVNTFLFSTKVPRLSCGVRENGCGVYKPDPGIAIELTQKLQNYLTKQHWPTDDFRQVDTIVTFFDTIGNRKQVSARVDLQLKTIAYVYNNNGKTKKPG